MASTAAVLSPDGVVTATAAYPGPSTPTAATHPDAAGGGGHGKAVTGNEGDGKTEKRKPAGWRHFVAGGVGGMTGAIVTSPFDVVKTRLQSDLFRDAPQAIPSASSSTTSIPKTILDAGKAQSVVKPAFARPGGASGLLWNFVETGQMIRNIYVNEGPKALFKGLGPTLVGVVPARSINFSTYAASKTFLGTHFPDVRLPTSSAHGMGAAEGYSGEANPIIHLGAAAIAGICTATATNPIWVVKTRLQLEARHRTRSLPTTSPNSSLSKLAPAPSPALKAYSISSTAASAAARAASDTTAKDKMLPAFRMTLNIVKKEGVLGLYRGLSASYLGVTEGVIQWVLYERLKRISTQTYPGQPAKSKLAEWVGIVGSSGGAKMVASLITYPHEVIRTRLRQPEVNGKMKYTGLWQTLRLVIAEEGAASLYGGLSAHLMRVVPNAACMFTIYEIALRL